MVLSRISKEVHARVFELTLALYRVTDFFPQGEVLRKNIREKANEIFGSVTEYGNSSASAEEAASIIGKIGSMRGFLAIARSLRLVNPVNIAVLEREYGNLANFFNKELEEERGLEQEGESRVSDPRNERPVYSEKIGVEPLPTWDEFSSSPKAKGHHDHKGQDIKIKRTKNDSGIEKPHKTVNDSLTPISEILNQRQQKIVAHLKNRDQAKISDFYSFFTNISSKTIQRDLQDLISKNMLKKDGEKRWTVYSLNYRPLA